MQDKTIDNALLALRKQMLRGGREGLEHVEALMALRNISGPRVLPPKRSDVARKGAMSRLVLAALADGPKDVHGVIAYIAPRRPELDHAALYKRCGLALSRLKRDGAVRSEKGVWRLAP